MTKRSHPAIRRTLTFLGAAVLGIAAAGGAWWMGWVGPALDWPIHASWAYDISRPEYVYGAADFVVVATVTRDLGTADRELGTTAFELAVEEVWKGSVPPTIEVLQTGFRRGRHTYEFKEFPLLEVGKTYVLALTPEPGEDRLLVRAGPIRDLGDGRFAPLQPSSKDDPVYAQLRDAVQRAEYPPMLKELLEEDRAILREWLADHPGYASDGPADLSETATDAAP